MMQKEKKNTKQTKHSKTKDTFKKTEILNKNGTTFLCIFFIFRLLSFKQDDQELWLIPGNTDRSQIKEQIQIPMYEL